MEPSVKREVKEFIQNKFSSQFLILHFSSHPAAPAALRLWRRNFSENSRVSRGAGVFGTQNFFRVYFVPRGAPPFKIGSEGKVFLWEPVRIYLKRDLVHFFFVYSFGSEQFQKSQHRHSMIAVREKSRIVAARAIDIFTYALNQLLFLRRQYDKEMAAVMFHRVALGECPPRSRGKILRTSVSGVNHRPSLQNIIFISQSQRPKKIKEEGGIF